MRSGLEKINITQIISDNLSTFRSPSSGKFIFSDLILFFIFPFSISLLLEIFGVKIDNNVSTLLIAVYSIFAGLLFSLMIFIFDKVSKISSPLLLNDKKGDSFIIRNASLRVECFKDLSFNVSFEILICLISIFLILISSIFSQGIFFEFSSFLIFYSVILFFLNLLVILKTIHKLLFNEINVQDRIIRDKARSEGEVIPW